MKDRVCLDISINNNIAKIDSRHNYPTINVDEFEKIRIANTNNPMISHLNVNHLRNKICEIRELTRRLYPNVLAISETKIDTSFPNAMFTIDEYYNPADFRKDRDGNGGGLLIYIKKGTPCKRLKTYEEANIESICFEITIKSRKWFILAFYRPPNNENIHTFFNYISKCTEKALCKYENIVLLGDINIDTLKKKGSKVQLFNQFCETFDMTNLIKSNTCFTKSSESSIDIILTNRPRFFFHCQSVETGISDVHTMVCTLMRSQIKKVNPVKIQ